MLASLQEKMKSKQEPTELWKEQNRWKQHVLETSKLVQAHFSELGGVANNNAPPVERHV